MAKLGIDRSYLLVNTFLYSVYGQQGGERHASDEKIAAYGNRWLDAILASNSIEAVLALGHLADGAWQAWRTTATGKGHSPAYEHVTHPTEPDSASGGDPAKLAAAAGRSGRVAGDGRAAEAKAW
jgi:hypothetical protein